MKVIRLTSEVDTLIILELNDLIKGSIHIVQIVNVIVFHVVSGEVIIVEEHLSHLENWDSSVDWTTETTFPNQVWQGSKMQ